VALIAAIYLLAAVAGVLLFDWFGCIDNTRLDFALG